MRYGAGCCALRFHRWSDRSADRTDNANQVFRFCWFLVSPRHTAVDADGKTLFDYATGPAGRGSGAPTDPQPEARRRPTRLPQPICPPTHAWTDAAILRSGQYPQPTIRNSRCNAACCLLKIWIEAGVTHMMRTDNTDTFCDRLDI